MSQLVTVFGGSGFVGRSLVRQLANSPWRVRIASRHSSNLSLHLGTEVELVDCAIQDQDSVNAALQGASAVVNCVGILNQHRTQTFASVQAKGAATIAQAASSQGVNKAVLVSAIGANAAAQSEYSRTKAAAEAVFSQWLPQTVILRPSVIFGKDDQFFNRFAAMIRLFPLLPLVGADTRFQPVYVEDVAQAARNAIHGQVPPGIYELGGPDIQTFRELMHTMLTAMQRRARIVALPWWWGSAMAYSLDTLQTLSRQWFVNTLLTRDQLDNLRLDNCVAPGARGFTELGITPTAMNEVIADYLGPVKPKD